MSELPIELRFNHIGVAVRNLEQARQHYCQAFGFRVLSDVFQDPVQQVSVVFVGAAQDFTDRRAKAFVLELIAPLTEDSHLQRLLSAGGGAYHMCFEVPDIAEAIQHFRSHQCLLVRGPDPAVAYYNQPIAWLFTQARQLVELVQIRST